LRISAERNYSSRQDQREARMERAVRAERVSMKRGRDGELNVKFGFLCEGSNHVITYVIQLHEVALFSLVTTLSYPGIARYKKLPSQCCLEVEISKISKVYVSAICL
jgi:hypothetical protein